MGMALRTVCCCRCLDHCLQYQYNYHVTDSLLFWLSSGIFDTLCPLSSPMAGESVCVQAVQVLILYLHIQWAHNWYAQILKGSFFPGRVLIQCNSRIVLFTYLQHSDPTIPYYRKVGRGRFLPLVLHTIILLFRINGLLLEER